MNPQEREVISGIFQRLEAAADQPREPEADRLIAEKIRQQPYAPYAMAQTIFVQEQALTNLHQENERLKAEVERLQSQPQQSGGFLSGLFGGGSRAPEPSYRPAPHQSAAPGGMGPSGMGGMAPGGMRPGGPWGQRPGMGSSMGMPGGMMQPGMQAGPFGQPRGGSGFLGTAMATAAGVAGGMMLGSALSSAFSGAGDQAANGLASLTGAGETPAADAAGADQSDLSPFGGGQESGVQDARFDDGGDFGGDFGGGDEWA